MIAIALLLVAAVAPIVGRRAAGDVCPPPVIAASLWCGTLGLYALRLLPYPTLRPATVALLAATVVILVAGSAAASAWIGRRPAVVVARPVPSISWVVAYAVVALAGTAWFVVLVVRTMPDGFGDAPALRLALGTYRIPSTFLFLQLFAIATPLVTLARGLGGTRIPLPLAALALVCAAGTVVSTDRTQSFLLVLSAAFMVAYRFGPEVSLRRTLIGGGVVVVLLVTSFLAIETWVRKTPDHLGLFLRLPGLTWVPGRGAVPTSQSAAVVALARAGQRLAGIYEYATGSYPALDRLLEAPPPRTGGAHIAFPLLRPLERAGLIRGPVPSPIPDYVVICPEPVPGGTPLIFNAYTFLYYPLVDFGVIGAVLYALLIAVASGAVYGWMRRDRRDPLRLLVAGQVATALALTVFVNKFNNTPWWYVLVLTVLPYAATAGLRRARVAVGRG